jgi:HK97 family phage prohead protease
MATSKNGSRTREAGGAVRLAFAVQAPTAGPENDRTIEVVACTSGVNNHSARVDAASWNLDRYALNPVVLYGHSDASDLLSNVRPEDTMPIGKASNVRVEGDNLLASITFATEDINPFAERVLRAFRGGYLNAVSVGFLPHSVTYEVVNDQEIAVLSGCELFEISIVPLPADPGAVAIRNSLSLQTFASKARSPMKLNKSAAEAAPPVDPKAAESVPEAEKPVEQAATVKCPECGFECDPTFKFCPNCGESMTEDQADQAPEGEPAQEQAAPCAPVDGEPKAKTLQSLTGTRTRTQALGVIQAWQLAAQELPRLQARISELEGAQSADERTALIEKLTADRKITPAMVTWAKSTPIESLKAFAAVAAPIVALTNKVNAAQPSTKKLYEELSSMERHDLYEQDRAAFEALRADYQARSGR